MFSISWRISTGGRVIDIITHLEWLSLDQYCKGLRQNRLIFSRHVHLHLFHLMMLILRWYLPSCYFWLLHVWESMVAKTSASSLFVIRVIDTFTIMIMITPPSWSWLLTCLLDAGEDRSALPHLHPHLAFYDPTSLTEYSNIRIFKYLQTQILVLNKSVWW